MQDESEALVIFKFVQVTQKAGYIVLKIELGKVDRALRAGYHGVCTMVVAGT